MLCLLLGNCKKISLLYRNLFIDFDCVQRKVLWRVLARLSQSLWTTTQKSFYHPNQLMIRCIVLFFKFLINLPLSVVIQTHWLYLAIEKCGSRKMGNPYNPVVLWELLYADDLGIG